jgi:hypothetical protein
METTDSLKYLTIPDLKDFEDVVHKVGGLLYCIKNGGCVGILYEKSTLVSYF